MQKEAGFEELPKKADTHFNTITNFDFVVTFTVCKAVLVFVKGLTGVMQGTSIDRLGVFGNNRYVVKTLSPVRQNKREKHAK